MTAAEARRVLESITGAWVEDPGSDIVWAGPHEGRWGVRMAQQARDFTTVWFDVGQRTLGIEAYVLPATPSGREDVYRLCLVRNAAAWRVHFALDAAGDVYLRGRIPLDAVSEQALDEAVGAVYELVEISFPAMVRLGFPKREKSS